LKNLSSNSSRSRDLLRDAGEFGGMIKTDERLLPPMMLMTLDASANGSSRKSTTPSRPDALKKVNAGHREEAGRFPPSTKTKK
jgi:hypothetical protein